MVWQGMTHVFNKREIGWFKYCFWWCKYHFPQSDCSDYPCMEVCTGMITESHRGNLRKHEMWLAIVAKLLRNPCYVRLHFFQWTIKWWHCLSAIVLGSCHKKRSHEAVADIKSLWIKFLSLIDCLTAFKSITLANAPMRVLTFSLVHARISVFIDIGKAKASK